MIQFEAIQKHKSLQVSSKYATRAAEQASSMKEIAEATERKTYSMNTITVVTLFFLPPTFVAVSLALFHVRFPPQPRHLTAIQTFFQAGILQFQMPDSVEGLAYLQVAGFFIFLGLSIFLIVAVFSYWGWSKRRKGRKQEQPRDAGDKV